jgi:elongation factor 1-alpha
MSIETDECVYSFTVSPGHPDYVKAFIKGVIQADAGIFVIDAELGPFASSDAEYEKLQASLAFPMGIRQLIVAVNKMDTVNYEEEKFEDIVGVVSEHLVKVGYNLDKVKFVPTCGFDGDNLVDKSDMLEWYDGPCLFDLVTDLKIPKRHESKPFRLPIQRVFKISGVGTVAIGTVEAGVLKQGEEVTFQPRGFSAECKSIECLRQSMSEVTAGYQVGFNIRGLSVRDIEPGYMLGYKNDDLP